MKPTPTIDRRGWLATWLQKRRRERQHKLLPAPVLVAQYPTQVVWTWDYANPYRWNAYLSLNNGLTWQFDDWKTGDARMYAPDGGSSLILIVGVDDSGNEITARSNAVRPDDAPLPLEAPILARAGSYYQGTTTVPASVWQFAQSDSYYDFGPVQDWVDGADLVDAAYDLLPPNQAQSEQAFSFCACRYQVDGVWSPWCAVI